MRKWDLIHALADIHGYRSLLEISTAGTAASYPEIDRTRFTLCRRLSYLTPVDWTDGAPIDYRSPDRDTADCIRQIRAERLTFDIVFLDAWHESETARRDMNDALSLVGGHGIVLVHDCLPDSPDAAVPFRGDLISWWGVSYKLYLDVLMARSDLWYCTVDSDCGCGVIRSRRHSSVYRRWKEIAPDIVRAWGDNSHDCAAAYRVYDTHRKALMNVVSVEEFLAAERAGPPPRFLRFLPGWKR